ncbi:MAG TPA: 4-aminobutyrate--2-oxoglutarate transaminase [Actinomycetota bacterium]|jgi:4-aminobutyrate aminotransferase/(S)-3-amino-2-methylpropionate transaminase
MDIAQERRVVTQIPGPNSRRLLERRLAAVPKAVAWTAPVFVEAASGAIVLDVDGNQLIDLGAGLAVLNVGNAAPAVVDAVRDQVEKFTHTCMHVTMSEPYVALAERLNALVPGDVARQTIFVNSGAEAVENAVKISRYSTKRQAVVVFDHAFHGRTLMAMTLTAKAMPYKQGFGPFAPEVYRMPMAYPYRCPTGASYDECGPSCADTVINNIDKQIGAGNVACILIEPVQGEGGFIVPAEGFIPRLAEYAAANGIVFVADEVQSGFGRTGAMFGIEHEGVVPDLVTTAKSLAGGLPLGAVTGRAEIMDAVHAGGLGGTYGGNPLACAAGLAVLDTIERDGLIERANAIGELMLGRLREMAGRFPLIGDVRGRGAMVAIELVEDRATKVPAKAAASRLIEECYTQGVLILKAGTYDNVIRFLPPLTISDELLSEGLDVLEKALATVEADATK